MQIKIPSFFLFAILLLNAGCKENESNKIDLSGNWQFAIDSLDQGKKEKWFTKELPEGIILPGSMAENGKGKDVSVETHWTGNMWNDSLWYKDPAMAKYRQADNIKVPFWLSPIKVYCGVAWYQKKITVPNSWHDQSINLFLERPHWESQIWVDDLEVGMQNYLATPHIFNLDGFLSPGEHTLTLRIDNRIKDIDVGRDAHSISDNTQTNWNGIVGKIQLLARAKINVESVSITPDIGKKVAVVRLLVNSNKKEIVKIKLQAKSRSGFNYGLPSVEKEVDLSATNSLIVDYPMGEQPALWDEFSPNLYDMDIVLKSTEGEDLRSETFGMREFIVEGKHFSINGRPIFLRGTLECAIFPLTGYPPTNRSDWEKIFITIKNHGLNHMRFHSWCPPEAAFEVADEQGIYLQVEASAWTTIGDGEPIDQWVYKEAENILATYGNHPSFVMMAYGNEPGGKNHKDYLSKFVAHFKKKYPNKIFTGAAGWPLLDNADYFNSPTPRIQRWAEGLNSVINKDSPQTTFDYKNFVESTPIPVVSHEIGQWCVYPNFKEMEKYTGVLQPKNFEIFKESLDENQMAHLADAFLMASGKLQTLCYKADIEAALRTKNFAGFQLLDLHDFPGQGTALVGVLDAFWEEKGYVAPEEFRRFCSDLVPLIRIKKRVFSSDENLEASVEAAHYGAAPKKDVPSSWKILKEDGNIFQQGKFNNRDLPLGNVISIGKISIDLNNVDGPLQLTIQVKIGESINEWPIWVYPSTKPALKDEQNLLVTHKFDQPVIDFLEEGGKVLLSIKPENLHPDKGGEIGLGFSSIFWNTSWTNGQKPHTLGILCDPEHPALIEFPTEYHSNWQWWDAMNDGGAIILDDFHPDLKPIVRVIDDWFENRRTALIFEVNVGAGRLLVSGVDLLTNQENRLEAQQLLYSLKKYMLSDDFNPLQSVNPDKIQNLLKSNDD
jgi:hypothetical protein